MSIAVASPGVSIRPSIASSHPSGAYWARFLMQQSSGNPTDSIGGKTLAIDADLVTAGTAWSANSGWFSCITDAAGGNGGASIPNSQINSLDLRVHSILWSIRLLIPSSVTAQEAIMGFGGGSVSGVQMTKRPTGHELQLRINRGAAGSFGVVTGTALNDDAEHHVVLAVDGPSNIGYGWVDNVVQFTGQTLAAAGSGTGAPATEAFGFGHEGLGSGTTIAAQFRDVHLFQWTGNLPARLADGVAWLFKNKYDWMPAAIWP